MRYLRFTLSIILVFTISLVAFAQNASTSLRGLVSDPTGASIPHAHVTVLNAANGATSQTTTNDHGEYSFQQITPGSYSITVDAPGFGQYTVTAQLLVAQPATINAKLQVNVAVTSVDVSATTQTLNTIDASIGNAVNNETIMMLPSEGRNPQTLLALQPGVLYIGNSDSTESRNGTVSGARSDQTNVTLDGLDNNDQVAPAAFTGVLRTSLDATEEFRVTTSNANADTGRSSGGQINLVTKAGTNALHGSIYEYNRSNFGVANDWFNKSAQLSSGEPNRPGHLIRNTYGIALGGPLKHDKIFLFGAYEGNRQNEAAQTTRTVPTASLRAGNLRYFDTDGNTVTLTPSQVASMDPNCSANGTCPLGPGPNPASLALFQLYPLPNGSTEGDGLNTGSYSFAASVPIVQNVYISRFDYNISEKHRFYIRASMQNDSFSEAPYYPGQPPNIKRTDNSKGISANYTWTPISSVVNNLRYGFIRQSIASTGVGQGQYATFRSLDTPEATTRSSSTLVPTHNIIDDYTWTKGKHSIQFGVNYRRFTYENSTDANSYSTVQANASWMLNSGFSGTGSSFDPSAFGFPDVSSGFSTNYDYAVSMLAGLTNDETGHFNYQLSADGKTGSLLGIGAPVKRNFRSNEFEYYVQDTFRPISNLTIVAGIRHTILQTPYETNGQQVQPTINIHDWFLTRGAQAALGNSVQPEISFAPSGQARGAKPFYPMNWGNIAPRFSLAFSPAPERGTWINKLLGGAGKSSIRAGYGIYYDHYGQGLVTNYSRAGSFSLSSSITNPASSLTADTTPRFTGLHNLPDLIGSADSTITYPQTPSDDPYGTGFAITNGLDDHLKTPYSHAFNLSWQRELPGGFTFEADYVGRLGRHLLQQLDLAQPLDLVDNKSGTDYYTAATQLSKYVDQGQDTVPNIAYFENLFPQAAGGGNSATQNIYSDLWRFNRGNETAGLYELDIDCFYGCPNGRYGRFWPLQYSSLFVTSSMGSSSYNAGQFILRHPMKNGIQFDLSYTYSRSLDLGSDSESNPTNTTNNYGFILDAFNPSKNYSISDFNTTHIVTADWVIALPFGRNKHFAGNANPAVDALIGGWSISGIARVSSGLPFGIYDGDGWGTNWEWESAMVQTAAIKKRKHIDANGSPQIFDDPEAARSALRDPYPGEAGQRNKFTGDGYLNIDAGMHKGFHIGDRFNIQLAGELFNVTNTARFDVHSIAAESTDGPQLGVYSSQLTQYRRLQLSGRIQF